jgi:hypothetical protein
MITKLTLGKVTLAEIKRFVKLIEQEVSDYEWTQVESITLTDQESQSLQEIKARLRRQPVHRMNEATLWGKVIYPLLLLVEQTGIEVWAEVPLQAQYTLFELEGVADGVLGKSVTGRLESPYLVVIETKRGVENQDPVPQLYGQLLAAAHINWEQEKNVCQSVFGCYTIADSWTFVRAEVTDIETDLPTLRVEYSREYTEKTEAETILKILKRIVAKYLQPLD